MSDKARHLKDLVSDSVSIEGNADVEISTITSDSRVVETGALFAALPGTQVDGMRFVGDAIAAGANCVLAPEIGEVPSGPTVLRSDDVRRDFALMAARFFAPQPETVVAVTGTSGKTSVASFVRQIWLSAKLKAASVGTLGIVSPNGDVYGGLTTPDPVSLHRSLQSLADDGCTHVALEASSHGIDQRRLDGVSLKAAGFTNLGRDHLDYHETTEAYFDAKARLFDTLLPQDAPAIINVDDSYGQLMAERARAAGHPVQTVGFQGDDIRIKSVAIDGFGQSVNVNAFGQDVSFLLPLVGEFQVSNAILAAGLAIAGGCRIEEAFSALESLKGAPGRLELVGRGPGESLCFVDYAHKPEALDHTLRALKPFTNGRLIVVFGAGGDRDPGKRAIMGGIAEAQADIAIVTDDNPRNEDPALVRRAILDAAPKALEIGDRGKAIRHGVGLLEAGDVLVVAGKGHETGQLIKGVMHPFSDHDELRMALSERGA
ncbi:UDP-N-acetylmuramoyl-L-alanyl-D-glutamate--2,6-diaminopimelate ligase [Coralliovum pocilloporae]|uniref:UDP-N-acetylmuramoyl-L-alanyl-D-glutamate--2, 6-diaminopimelate ligase n=1 Tax=Coralliovum pocilloporae TaxID=3066369 RepID=UPI00330763A8